MQANKRRHPKAKPRKRFWSFIRKLVLWCLVMAAIGAAVGYFGFMMAWKRYDNWAAEDVYKRQPGDTADRHGKGGAFLQQSVHACLFQRFPQMGTFFLQGRVQVEMCIRDSCPDAPDG